jgi:hypothetical protein
VRIQIRNPRGKKKGGKTTMAGLLPIVSLQNCMRMSPIVFVLTLSHTAAISLLKALKNVKKTAIKRLEEKSTDTSYLTL